MKKLNVSQMENINGGGWKDYVDTGCNLWDSLSLFKWVASAAVSSFCVGWNWGR